ncbi:hypothetical protein NKH80_04185 [Mesorhizobium sp. M0904]|uniref:pPIWI-associating nuclease domain-containing protein n=1 Tax=unclassified Mesorhizobium TaxID=325217 RepID=UPI00333DE1FD
MNDNTTARRQQVIEAVQAKDYQETQAWSDLDALSSSTQVDTIETFEKEIRFDGNDFQGPLTWYVVLRYGMDTADPLETSESFPGTFHGSLVDEVPVIQDMTVDTSSFYGEAGENDASDI